VDTLIYVVIGAVVGAVLLVALLFRVAWRIAEPDEALVISGFRQGERPEGVGESMSFRIVTGRGCWATPGITRVRRLSLEAHESEISVPCVSQQKIAILLKGVVVYKVGDDFKSIANAARRFLDRPALDLESKVQNVFMGHLRSIAGSMTVEDMIGNQDQFAGKVRDTSGMEMESFGLVIDSFQIQSINDNVGYIENLSVPHQAEVMRDARIRRAQADREAVQEEQAAEAQKAEAIRNTEIKKAAFQADVDKATREAQQQGPLAEAKALQAVVEEKTRVAELESQQKEKQLQIEVRKPADAKAYEMTTIAAAERDARIHQAEAEAAEVTLHAQAAAEQTRVQAQAQADATRMQAEAQARATKINGEADGAAIEARGRAEGAAVQARMEAEATGILKRSEALANNQEAVISQQIAENLPAIVAAASKAFENVGNFTVLNGAEGVTGALAQIIAQAGALTDLARTSLMPRKMTGNGAGPAIDTTAVEADRGPEETEVASPAT
jgi:flotillin